MNNFINDSFKQSDKEKNRRIDKGLDPKALMESYDCGDMDSGSNVDEFEPETNKIFTTSSKKI